MEVTSADSHEDEYSMLPSSNQRPIVPRKKLNPFDDSSDNDKNDEVNLSNSSLGQQPQPLGDQSSPSPLIFPDSLANNQILSPQQEQRSLRLREEAVRRLVSDINRTATTDAMGVFPHSAPNAQHNSILPTSVLRPSGLTEESMTSPAFLNQSGMPGDSDVSTKSNTMQQEELLIASTIASSIERGLDREFHNELKKQIQGSTSVISKICHDHSDVFLGSVGRVVDLGGSCASVRRNLDQGNQLLQTKTANLMLNSASDLEYVRAIDARARATSCIVTASHRVAVLLERARKQASLMRPKEALDAVDDARKFLTSPLGSLLGIHDEKSADIDEYEDRKGTGSSGIKRYYDILMREGTILNETDGRRSKDSALRSLQNSGKGEKDKKRSSENMSKIISSKSGEKAAETSDVRLEDTPFGMRAMELLPKIENEVMLGARRGLNKWFLSIRERGDSAKAGRAALRRCACNIAIGPGKLGLGGQVQGYSWRAKNADNLISRVSQSGRVSRAARMGYWFERDIKREIARLESLGPGMERRADAFAAAFGWFRCWGDSAPLSIEEVTLSGVEREGSVHGASRHGTSRHGGSLSFRAGSSHGFGRGKASTRTANQDAHSQWSTVLVPRMLFEDSSSKPDDDEILNNLPESVHLVRRAEGAFALLGKTEEFRLYYEQNRFGDMRIGGKTLDDDGFERETRSSLSSLTGDDVSLGSDRMFFSKSLPHFCASIIGFCAIEAALESGNFQREDGENDGLKAQDVLTPSLPERQPTQPPSSFRESSMKYERNLIAELATLHRTRAIKATLVELARASSTLAAFRSALKIMHPSSGTRKSDKELLAMDHDILMTGLKIAQEEQLQVTVRIVKEGNNDPLQVKRKTSDYSRSGRQTGRTDSQKQNVPTEEVVNFPFGLSEMKQKHSMDKAIDSLEVQSSRRTSLKFMEALDAEYHSFSQPIPDIIRSIHARAIIFAAFLQSQQEIGQIFPVKKGGGVAAYVFDCVEECVTVTAVGLRKGLEKIDEISVAQAVQVTANITALQNVLPRLFGTLMRGLCHVEMARAEELDESFEYADDRLKGADKSCDQEIGSMFNTIFHICRNKIDTLIHFSLDNFQWVARTVRDTPNTYCESLIEYMRTTFKSLGPLDDGSKAGLHFSCCGHVAERLVMIVAGKEDESSENTLAESKGDTLTPMSKIDAFGMKNLSIDVEALEVFADGTGIPQLRECFNELRCLCDAMLDRNLPNLLLPENESNRRRKYPFLNLEKIYNVLEKYQGTGLGDKILGSSAKEKPFLMLEKKEVIQLLKVVKSQLD